MLESFRAGAPDDENTQIQGRIHVWFDLSGHGFAAPNLQFYNTRQSDLDDQLKH